MQTCLYCASIMIPVKSLCIATPYTPDSAQELSPPHHNTKRIFASFMYFILFKELSLRECKIKIDQDFIKLVIVEHTNTYLSISKLKFPLLKKMENFEL